MQHKATRVLSTKRKVYKVPDRQSFVRQQVTGRMRLSRQDSTQMLLKPRNQVKQTLNQLSAVDRNSSMLLNVCPTDCLKRDAAGRVYVGCRVPVLYSLWPPGLHRSGHVMLRKQDRKRRGFVSRLLPQQEKII